MANTKLFSSQRGQLLPATNAVNGAGSPAYALDGKHQLAQLVATGCMNNTFYASAESQLQTLLALCQQTQPMFVAKAAIFGRKHAYMKDAPALLVGSLSINGEGYFPDTFTQVVDNGKMLRNFVQILRSGVLGRKSLGTRPKRLVQNWLNSASEKALLSAAVGNDPSLADVVRMVHPKPSEKWREAFFAWLIGREYNEVDLPPITKAFEAYKRDRSLPVPEVPFQLLTALDLTTEEWKSIALNAGWQMLRMNLNTFARHGVFDSEGMVSHVASRLRNADEIKKARVFPYQLLAAYKNAKGNISAEIADALQDAMELGLQNVPAVSGKIVVCADVSGSMSSPVSGYRKGASSAVRCIDVAALVSAALLRKNKTACVLPFETKVIELSLNSRDSVMTNAEKLASIGGGGTNCSAALQWLNEREWKADLVIFVSDNESWMDARTRPGATQMMLEWERFKRKNSAAKLVCLDIQPNVTSQAAERNDILNIGGFSDEVFSIIDAFAKNELTAEHWVGVIESVAV